MILLYSVLTIGILGMVASGVLSFAARKFAVPVDHRLEELVAVLPGANCAACGYASCRAAAKAILAGEAAVSICLVGGRKVSAEVARIMGAADSGGEATLKVAVVRCQGGSDVATEKFTYYGVKECQACQLIAGGHKACGYGCLGFADCVRVCPFGAIMMGPQQLPVIVEDKCTACGKCVKACPRNIIELIPRQQQVYLGCVSRDKLKKVKEVCKRGCIACGLCARPVITPEELITMGDNLPIVHWQKDKDLKALLQQAVAKCPGKCFILRGDHEE